MRNRCLITVTTYRGSRHFSLTRFMRRVALGLAAVTALVLLVGGLSIHWLSGRVAHLQGELAALEQERSRIRASKQALATDKQALEHAVSEQSRGLAVLEEELERIEQLIGLETFPETPLNERMETASHTALEQRLMLTTVPNGHPVPYQGVTSSYGNRVHPVHGSDAFHGGVDLRASHGTPIKATADGVVQWAGAHKSSGLGKMVQVVHNFGFTTLYGHMSEVEVKPGQHVRKGDPLGRAGSSGVATGAHLHYEVRYLERRLNPQPFLQWSLDDYDLIFEREERVQWQSLADAVRRTAAPQGLPSLLKEPALSATWPWPAASMSMASSKAR